MRDAYHTIQLKPGDTGAPEGSLCAKLLKAGFKVSLRLLEEDTTPEDSYPEADQIKTVRDAIESGDVWAWFCAEAVVLDPASGLKGTDFLGACGAYTEASWFQQDGYWPDMVAEAFRDLKRIAANGATLAARLDALEA